MSERSLAADTDGGHISLIAVSSLSPSFSLSLALLAVVSPTSLSLSLSVLTPIPILSCLQTLSVCHLINGQSPCQNANQFIM